MNLGIFLAVGDSFEDMKKTGQDVRFLSSYVKEYSKNFERVYIFSYASESVNNLPKNVILIPNKYHLHRYIYAILLPILNIKQILSCNVFRCFHLSGTMTAIVTKILFSKKFTFNYAYDYQKMSKLEAKSVQAFLFGLIKPIAVVFASKIFAANQQIIKKLPKEKIVYLPNGVDTSLFKPSKKLPTNNKRMILSVGRLEKQKNFLSLVDAVKTSDAKLIIIGSGSLKQRLIKRAKENGVDLEIIDKVINTKMPKIFNQADLFVLPSFIEGSPKVLLEAMACKIPTIGANVEGIKEIIIDGKNGLLCEPEPRQIRKKILFLMSHKPEAQKMSETAYKLVREKYNLQKLLQQEIKAIKTYEF